MNTIVDSAAIPSARVACVNQGQYPYPRGLGPGHALYPVSPS